jgi:Septum formation
VGTLESSGARHEAVRAPPDQSAGQGKPDVAGNAHDGGRMAAPARVDAGSEPAPAPAPARRTSILVATAITVGALILVSAVAAGALVVLRHGLHEKTKVTYQVPAVFSLRTGDCFNSAPNERAVTVLPCASPHDAEVFATFRIAAPSWPGDSVVQQDASEGCMSRITDYMSPQLAADLSKSYVYPNSVAWQAGVRMVVCEVSAASGQLTGSVRQGSS